MKSRIIFILNFLWSSFIAFTLPVCIGVIFMSITGHSKGYAYDLGAEKDISVIIGFIELFVWLVLAIPSNIYVFKRISRKKKLYVLIPIILFAALFCLCVYLIGGWVEFFSFFHSNT